MVLTRSQINKPPPLESELEGCRLVEEELEGKKVPLTKAMAHEGEDYTKEKMEYIKLIKPLFEEISKDMTQHMVYITQQIEKGFELMASQMGSKGIIGDSGSSQSAEKKTMGENIISRTRPHNRPMNFRSHQGLLHLNLLLPKNILTFNFKLI